VFIAVSLVAAIESSLIVEKFSNQPRQKKTTNLIGVALSPLNKVIAQYHPAQAYRAMFLH